MHKGLGAAPAINKNIEKKKLAQRFLIFFPQIALAIGVPTSNMRGGWCTSSNIGRSAVAGDTGGWVYTFADWMWWRCWAPLLEIGGGVGGEFAGCHCWG